MKKKNILLIMTLLVLLAIVGAAAPAQAAVRNVPGTYATIQLAVTAAADGDTIQVAAGTYTGTINIDARNNLSIIGDSSATVIIKPATQLDWNVGGYAATRHAPIRVVNSTNITFSNITGDWDTIKGVFDRSYGFLFWNSSGGVGNSVLKNMSVLDTAFGGFSEVTAFARAPLSGPYTDGSRAEVAFTNNQIINGGRLGILTHGFVNATITGNTIYKTTPDFGYGMEIESYSTGVIRDNTIYGYNTAAWSDGSQSAGVYINNAFTSPAMEPGLPHINKNVTLDRNEVYGSQWGMYVGNSFNNYAGDTDIILSYTNNDFHNNSEGGAAISDEDKALGSSVSITGGNNALTNNGTWGAYDIYTLGDGDVTFNVSGESLNGNPYGLLVEETAPGSTYNITINNSDISGNTTGTANTLSGATTITAENNWWGAATGPGGVGPGTGNSVTTKVDFTPWRTTQSVENYDNAAVSVVNVPGAQLSVPAGNGATIVGAISVTTVSTPIIGTVAIDAQPNGADFGSNVALWPTVTLDTVGTVYGVYTPYYYNGTSWVPYASTDYANTSGVLGSVTISGGQVSFRVKHFTHITGHGTPATGLNVYVMMLLAAITMALGTVLLKTKSRFGI